MKEQDLRKKVKDVLEMPLTEIDFDADQCVQITIDYAREEAISFNRWMHENCFEVFNTKTFYIRDCEIYQDNYTFEELYEIYLTTKTQNK